MPIIVSPSSAPTAIVEVTPEVSTIETNTPTDTVEKATSEDGMNSTPTPHPPTDTPTPAPPSTPTPTNTSRPTPTPTATIDADPMVYDNFNNPAFDGGWNTGLWEPSDTNGCKIAQQEGFLSFSCTDPTKDPNFNARRLSNITFSDFSFVETKLMLASEIQTSNGNTAIGFSASTDNVFWGIDCGLLGGTQDNFARIFCWVFPAEKLIEGPTVNYNTWHTVRIEINPETVELRIFADGQRFGSYNPPEADILKQEQFRVSLSANPAEENGTLVTGYFDDVRVGK